MLGWIKSKVFKSPELEHEECSQENKGFEISDKDNNKWIRDENAKVHDPINTRKDSTKHHFWEVNRSSKEEPSWIFSVPSESGKLFVTCNSSDNEVTLEHGSGSYFTMLFRSDKGVLFREASSCDRYLVHNKDGILEMLTTQNPTADMEWMIKYIVPSMEGGSLPKAYIAEIQQETNSKKWKSSGPSKNYPVQQIQTSSVEDWTITPVAWSKVHFSSGSYFVNLNLLFSDTAANYTCSPSGSGLKLQCYDQPGDNYVWGPDGNGDLGFTCSAYAAVWEFPLKNATYFIGDKIILLSEIPIDESKKV